MRSVSGSIHPGPPALGRGVVINPGSVVPVPWAAAPRVVVDHAALDRPTAAIDALREAWQCRHPVVIELGVPHDALRRPETTDLDPWRLPRTFSFGLERLFFLVWANTYDARGDAPVWWWGHKAARLGAQPGAKADIVLPDGRDAWVDGGPRGPVEVDQAIVHRESVERGHLVVARRAAPASELAADQLAVVTHPSGPARAVAPAGSGKTRVLVERLHHLVLDRGVEDSLVTAVAYNTRAAAELAERLHDAVRPEIRTLHSLGLEVLRDAARHHRRRPPVLLDERDVRSRLEPLIPVRPRANTDVTAPYLEGLADVRLAFEEPERVEATRDDAPGFAEVYRRYHRALVGDGAVDFDEMIFGAVTLLLGDAEARERSRARRRHLLIDEFQDLTPAYLLLVRLLAAPADQVLGVGDDDQVIYGYAGATPEHLVHFDRWFPGAAEYALEVNYRCPSDVVAAAGNLLSRNRRRVDKSLRAVDDRHGMQISRCPASEAAGTATSQVRAWIDAGTDPGRIAVLARVNATLLPYQVLLGEAGVPCRRPVDARILRRTGVRAAMAYLRLAVAGDELAGVDLAEVANRPSRKLNRQVTDGLRRRGRWRVEQLRVEAERMGGRSGERLAGLVDDVVALGERAAGADTATSLRFIQRVIGLGRAVETLDRSKGGDAAAHGDDLAALVAVAALHPEVRGFEAWLRATLERPDDPGGVHLSSVHRVKGLEWDAVAVVGVDAGLIPHRLATDVEEERRVLHVAITRARRQLLVLADTEAPSPFLDELREAGVPPAPATAPIETRLPAAAVSSTTVDPDAGGEPAVEVVVEVGTEIGLGDGFGGTITEIVGDDLVVALAGGGRTRIAIGTEAVVDGRTARLVIAAPDAGMFEALRAWRLERCRADGVPAYVVLSDEHLADVARRRPSTPEQLLACKGIGPARLERYGDDILAVVELDGT